MEYLCLTESKHYTLFGILPPIYEPNLLKLVLGATQAALKNHRCQKKPLVCAAFLNIGMGV